MTVCGLVLSRVLEVVLKVATESGYRVVHVDGGKAVMLRRTITCEKADHRFTPATRVGGGISRVACEACGSVQIDLIDDTPVTSVSARLRAVAESRTDGTRDVDLLVQSAHKRDVFHRRLEVG